MNIASLNKKFSIGNKLGFKEIAAEITAIEVDTALATASISLMGGQVLTWHPKSQQEPVLWVSKLAQYVPGKAIRGGVPICWPWFGAHPSDSHLPGHGFARVVQWEVASTNIDGSGVVEVELTLAESDSLEELRPSDWPASVSLSANIRIGEKLEITITTTNNSEREIRLTEGLHTYFYVSDIENVRVLGLDDCEYVDLTDGNQRRQQSGPIVFEGELGRIFVNCDNTSVIEDRKLARAIQVAGAGSRSIAVWNPWLETSSKMSDLGKEGWRSMVCVETANALENAVLIKPGQHHTTKVIYSVTTLD
jgi:glucose-6-phosphate 1-epimerase